MSSPDEDLNKQINHKFIRPTYKPFQDKPIALQKKIDIDENGLPTYKVERTSKSHNFSPLENTKMVTPIPALNYTPQNDNIHALPNQQELITHRRQMMEQMSLAGTLPPVPQDYTKKDDFTNKKHHNCCELYHEVQSCPVCKNVYTKNDGIYITVIVILLVIILFLLKKIFI